MSNLVLEYVQKKPGPAYCKLRPMEVDKVKLKELREDAALSISELADAAGVSRTTIWHLEKEGGNAQPRTIRKLARALGVEPRDLRPKRAD
jgi:transcriptional regulator with XRE-family HTH domain